MTSVFDIAKSNGQPWVKPPSEKITHEKTEFIPFSGIYERSSTKTIPPHNKIIDRFGSGHLPLKHTDYKGWYIEKDKFSASEGVNSYNFPDRGFDVSNFELESRSLVYPDGTRKIQTRQDNSDLGAIIQNAIGVLAAGGAAPVAPLAPAPAPVAPVVGGPPPLEPLMIPAAKKLSPSPPHSPPSFLSPVNSLSNPMFPLLKFPDPAAASMWPTKPPALSFQSDIENLNDALNQSIIGSSFDAKQTNEDLDKYYGSMLSILNSRPLTREEAQYIYENTAAVSNSSDAYENYTKVLLTALYIAKYGDVPEAVPNVEKDSQLKKLISEINAGNKSSFSRVSTRSIKMDPSVRSKLASRKSSK
jgi:hypothetical protein